MYNYIRTLILAVAMQSLGCSTLVNGYQHLSGLPQLSTEHDHTLGQNSEYDSPPVRPARPIVIRSTSRPQPNYIKAPVTSVENMRAQEYTARNDWPAASVPSNAEAVAAPSSSESNAANGSTQHTAAWTASNSSGTVSDSGTVVPASYSSTLNRMTAIGRLSDDDSSQDTELVSALSDLRPVPKHTATIKQDERSDKSIDPTAADDVASMTSRTPAALLVVALLVTGLGWPLAKTRRRSIASEAVSQKDCEDENSSVCALETEQSSRSPRVIDEVEQSSTYSFTCVMWYASNAGDEQTTLLPTEASPWGANQGQSDGMSLMPVADSSELKCSQHAATGSSRVANTSVEEEFETPLSRTEAVAASIAELPTTNSSVEVRRKATASEVVRQLSPICLAQAHTRVPRRPIAMAWQHKEKRSRTETQLVAIEEPQEAPSGESLVGLSPCALAMRAMPVAEPVCLRTVSEEAELSLIEIAQSQVSTSATENIALQSETAIGGGQLALIGLRESQDVDRATFNTVTALSCLAAPPAGIAESALLFGTRRIRWRSTRPIVKRIGVNRRQVNYALIHTRPQTQAGVSAVTPRRLPVPRPERLRGLSLLGLVAPGQPVVRKYESDRFISDRTSATASTFEHASNQATADSANSNSARDRCVGRPRKFVGFIVLYPEDSVADEVAVAGSQQVLWVESYQMDQPAQFAASVVRVR